MPQEKQKNNLKKLDKARQPGRRHPIAKPGPGRSGAVRGAGPNTDRRGSPAGKAKEALQEQ